TGRAGRVSLLGRGGYDRRGARDWEDGRDGTAALARRRRQAGLRPAAGVAGDALPLAGGARGAHRPAAAARLRRPPVRLRRFAPHLLAGLAWRRSRTGRASSWPSSTCTAGCTGRGLPNWTWSSSSG